MKIKSRKHAREIVAKAYCSECQTLRVMTPSGATCPHHKIHPHVTREELLVAPRAKAILERKRRLCDEPIY